MFSVFSVIKSATGPSSFVLAWICGHWKDAGKPAWQGSTVDVEYHSILGVNVNRLLTFSILTLFLAKKL